MYLSNIKLWNFRKYWPSVFPFPEKPNLDLTFNKWLNVLIWANDSWKTAILDAIKLVLKTNTWDWIKVDKEEDFYQDTKNIKIQLRFDDFEADEARNFAEFLCVDTTISTNPKEYLILNCEISKNTDRVFPFDVKAWHNWDLWILTAEQREYLNITYLKPLRDVKTEFIPKKWSRLSTILESHEAFKWKNRTHDLYKEFENLNKKIKDYFTSWLNGDLLWIEIKKTIKQLIWEFIDDSKWINFSVSDWDLKDILEKLKLTLENNINPWLWSLNRLFIASELLHLQRKDYDGLELWIIEEIEAHIHPQAQMKVIESLQNRIKDTKTQLIITTHSPNLASKVKLENLIICDWWSAFPMWEDYTKLEKKDYRFLEIFLDTTKSNLFFANWVILVEWWAEEVLLPSFAKLLKRLEIINKDLTETWVSVVNIWGTSFNRYSKIFHRKYSKKFSSTTYNVSKKEWNFVILKNITEDLINEAIITEAEILSFISNSKDIYNEISLPVSIITDIDIKPCDEWSDLLTKINEKEKMYSEQNVKCFVSPHWTLEYCLLLKKWATSTWKFREIVYGALKENRPQALSEDFPTYITWKNENQFSETLMKNHIDWFKWIKSWLALSLANILDNNSTLTRDDIENEESLQYLIKAIKYATRQ